jgi:signal transduction histidine kinase/CheY-like chemotaxis protein
VSDDSSGKGRSEPPHPPPSPLQPWREIVLLRLSTLILVLGAPTAVLLAWHHLTAGRWGTSLISVAGLPPELLVRFARGLPFRVRAALQIGVFLVGGILGYLAAGLAGSGAAIFVAATVLAALLLGARWGIAVLATSAVGLGLVGLLFAHGVVPVPDHTVLDPTLAGNWLRATAFYLVLSSTILAVVLYLIGRLEGSLRRSEELVAELQRGMRERERLESHLRSLEKTRAVGTLAAGIAHDFNNILAGLMGYAELARKGAPADSELRDDVDQILRAADRAKSLVARILAASRHREGERGPMYIQGVLEEVLLLLRAVKPADIEIRHFIAADCPPILGDPTQVHQLVMNLCTNALQAMRDGGGVLEVGLRQRHLSPDEAAAFPGLSLRGCAEIYVRDTGCGMDEATRARIFEPYFTTRRKGEGTGLGLATVDNIVHTYAGTVTVTSAPGKGSTFAVLLPLCQSATPPPPRIAQELPTGTERILLVDDEAQVAEMSRKTLSRLGYQVICHTSAESALQALEGDSAEFDLLVTDLSMPGMDGVQLARKIRELRPDIRIVVCTGLSDAAYEQELAQISVQKTLIKPVPAHELAAAIREVLGLPPTGTQ